MGIYSDNEDEDKLIVLTGEDGEDVEFEFLDCIDNRGKEYVILHPINEEKGVVVILRVECKGEDETYIGVETEEEARQIFDIFMKRSKDNFSFID